ncbi:FAD/NAD(P)-binding domain-containing protein [Lentinula edodes]|nr:FAD/NAD(P)-binding domain-containing protein [Lentinula edodes]
MRSLVLFTTVLILSSTSTLNASQLRQQPFRSTDLFEDITTPHEASSYEFKWPIHRVAIIGAGAGGLIAYHQFSRLNNFHVRLFERDSMPGGNWHYTANETSPNAPVPNFPTSTADFEPDLPPVGVKLPYEESFEGVEEERVLEVKIDQRAPKPIWERLGATGPRSYQEFRALPWPEQTPIDINRTHLQRYVRTFASFLSLNSNDNNPDVSYDTRVERVTKRYNITTSTENGQQTKTEAGWTLLLRQFTQTGNNSYKIRWWEEAIASGRFNAPNTPDIPGLSQWASLYPHLISHSRQYRRPEEFANQSVLVIGGSVSGTEIAEELDGVAGKVILSVRDSEDSAHTPPRKMHLSRVPRNVSIVPEIKSFHPFTAPGITSGKVELFNGTILHGFDRIILATGYRYSFPFLPQYINTSLRANETIPIQDTDAKSTQRQPLITDGTHIRSLHLDIFYIEEPTIGFINMNTGIETFLYSEFTSAALSKVWAGQAKLPSSDFMWARHWERVGKGYGRTFMAYGVEKQAAITKYLVGWLNQDAVKYGGYQLNLPSDNRLQISKLWVAARFPNYRGGDGSNGEWQPLSTGDVFAINDLGFDSESEGERERDVETWSVGRDDW